MGAADLERFRLKMREYRLLVNRSQGDLAAYLNLDYSELSNRLNAHKNARLSHDNVRTLVRALAEWGAITTQAQAEELLDLIACPHFDPVDLEARPLSKLAVSPLNSSVPGNYAKVSNLWPDPDAKVTAPAVQAFTSPALTSSSSNSQAQLATTARPKPVHNLPQNLNPLLGREKEVAQVGELLSRQSNRLVTLTGAGGSGKTSLALEVGRQYLPALSDGVYFVRLENVTQPESLIAEIARNLNLKETAAGHNLLQSLREFLREKEVLLILDNFEQLVGEGEVLANLLRETEHVKLLVTSRIPLQLSFEHEYAVGPLALPDKEALTRLTPGELIAAYPAVALFMARGQAVKSDLTISQENFQAVVEICRKVDGLPLALELAAARVRTFSPYKLLERLSLKILAGGARDLPARQRTLWDTIEWSYHLLSQDEQRLFASLSIFVGGCTLEAAEAICNPGGELALEIFEGIESLLTQNLLKQWQGIDGETRYGMLVTIREFGLEKLARSGEFEILEQRYRSYYLGMSRQQEPGMAGANRQVTKRLEKIESEYSNFRAVLFQALATAKAEEALELSVTLGIYYNSRGYFSEGLNLLEQSLAIPFAADSPNGVLRARALFWTGVFLNDYVKAYRCFEEALALQRQFNDKQGIIFSLNRLSEFNRAQGNYALSDRYLAESLALSLELNEEGALENTRSNLAMSALRQGNYGVARRYAEENLAMFRASNNRAGKAVALGVLGAADFEQGKYGEARRYFEQSLAIYREIGITWGLVLSVNCLGLVAVSQEENALAYAYSMEGLALSRKAGFKAGIALSRYILGLVALNKQDYPEARTNLEESLALYRERGDKLELARVLPFLALAVANLRGAEEAKSYYEESLVISHSLRNRLTLAQSLTGLAGLLLLIPDRLKLEQQDSLSSSNTLVRVVRLSGIISTLLVSCEAVMWPPFPQLYEQNLAVARTKLNEVAFKAAFAEGQAMSVEEAVAFALAE